MHWPEASFWIGITVFGTGLYFIIDGLKEKGHRGIVWLAIALTVLGGLAISYSIYAAYNAVPKIPGWVLLLVLTWILVGWDIYQRSSVGGGSERPAEAFANPKWTVVNGVKFRNATVVVDNKRFLKCTFENVTFSFEGKGPMEMIQCQANGNLSVETAHPIAREYAHLYEMLSSFPGGKLAFSAFDADGHVRPSYLRVTEAATRNPQSSAQNSSALGLLPTYRHDLEIELLALCVGTIIHGPATVFLLLKTWAKKDLNLIGLDVNITTSDGKHETTVLKNLSEWVVSEEFMDVRFNMKNRKKTILETADLSLIKEIESGIFREGHHSAKWVGCEAPHPFLREEDVFSVRVQFRDKTGIAKIETFNKEWPKTIYRIEDVAFMRL